MGHALIGLYQQIHLLLRPVLPPYPRAHRLERNQRARNLLAVVRQARNLPLGNATLPGTDTAPRQQGRSVQADGVGGIGMVQGHARIVSRRPPRRYGSFLRSCVGTPPRRSSGTPWTLERPDAVPTQERGNDPNDGHFFHGAAFGRHAALVAPIPRQKTAMSRPNRDTTDIFSQIGSHFADFRHGIPFANNSLSRHQLPVYSQGVEE